MSHITYEDVNGILSLVEIALARGSIKGDELAILNQIRNDCLQEVQDYQFGFNNVNKLCLNNRLKTRKRNRTNFQRNRKYQATADAKVHAQDASRILQNRVNELENQQKTWDYPSRF